MTFTPLQIFRRLAFVLSQPAVRHILTFVVGATILLTLPRISCAQSFWGNGLIQQEKTKGCMAGCLEAPPKNKDSAGFCRYVCGCIAEQNMSATEARNFCVAKYSLPASSKPLLKQTLFPARNLTENAEADKMTIRSQMRSTGLDKALVLDCAYQGGGAMFWYEQVPITRATLTSISKVHPLRRLGDIALKVCPYTLDEARKVSQTRNQPNN